MPKAVDGMPLHTVPELAAQIEKGAEASLERWILVRGKLHGIDEEEGLLTATLIEEGVDVLVMGHGFEEDEQMLEARSKPGEPVTLAGIASVRFGSAVELANAELLTDDQLRTKVAKFNKAPKFSVVVQSAGAEGNHSVIASALGDWSTMSVLEGIELVGEKESLTIVSGVTRETADGIKAAILQSSIYEPEPKIVVRPAGRTTE